MILNYALNSGGTMSCGCMRIENFRKRATNNIKHGYNRKGKRTRIYKCWESMRERCNNPHNDAFDRYGGRGITVCERWDTFSAFLADMGEPPAGWSIERVDNNKGYSPENCVWATAKRQMRNTRYNRILTVAGKTACLVEFAELYGLRPGTIRERLERGWPVERAVLEPLLR